MTAMKRVLILPLLLLPLLPSCQEKPASSSGIRELVARGSGVVALTEAVEYREFSADGKTLQPVYNGKLEFEKGVLKPYPGGTRGGNTISVTDDGWITIRHGKDTRIVPPVKVRSIDGTMP